MKTDESKVNSITDSGKEFKQLIKKADITPASITCKILSVTTESNERGIWLKFTARVNGYDIKFQLNRKADNVDEIAKVKEFEANFRKGDYNLTDCEVRVAGETYTDTEGKLQVYKSNIISIPYLSNIDFLGENYIRETKLEEFELASLEAQANAWRKQA
jgi:hypothetical protein